MEIVLKKVFMQKIIVLLKCIITIQQIKVGVY
jgi:hypothetical protein